MNKTHEMLTDPAADDRIVYIINNTEDREIVDEMPFKDYIRLLIRVMNRISNGKVAHIVNKQINQAYDAYKTEEGITPTVATMKYLSHYIK